MLFVSAAAFAVKLLGPTLAAAAVGETIAPWLEPRQGAETASLERAAALPSQCRRPAGMV